MAQASQVYGGDEINALILDPGAAWTRLGWSAEDGPSLAYSTNYAEREGQSLFGDDNTYIVRSNTEIKNPMKDGIVEDWDNATSLWKSALSQASPSRNTDYLTESPLLMTEPFWNPRVAQKNYMDFAFSDLQTPGFFIAKSPVLALFAAGRGSGIVVDAGAQTLSVTPVIDGLCLYKPARRSRKAGDFLNEQARSQLKEDIIPGYEIKSRTAVGPGETPKFVKRDSGLEAITQSFKDFQISRVLEQFKESMIQVSETHLDAQASTEPKSRLFEFPDGHQIELANERLVLGETLFRSTEPKDSHPSAMEVDSAETKSETSFDSSKKKSGETFNEWSSKGVSDLIVESLKACDVDARANLANNIVITGGTSLTQGFTERINQDLQREFPMLKIRIFASGNMVERRNSAWIGGSILASLGTFHQMWISKQEYEDAGWEQIAQKRCK